MDDLDGTVIPRRMRAAVFLHLVRYGHHANEAAGKELPTGCAASFRGAV